MKTREMHEDDLIESTGDMPAVLAIDAVAVYDTANGRVVHLHQVITFEGANRASPDEQVRHALEYAHRLRGTTERLATLHVADFKPIRGHCRVDLARQVLVEEPLPAAILKKLRQGKGRG
jgi:hypothetical protein